MPPVELPVRARAWLTIDGWLEIHVTTEDVPPSYRHGSSLPKVRLSIDGGKPHYLNQHGDLYQWEPPQ